MVIDGPFSDTSFDVDLGPVVLQDWSHYTVDSRYDLAQNATVNPATNQTYGGPQVMDNGLINGKNVWGDDGSSDQTGSRTEFTFEPNKKYLLRIVNTAIQSTFKFYIDGHSLTVISSDFVPIKSYTTDILNINIGKISCLATETSQY
jgi:FtsP/CotA-like multicopper oxidase with cupredoxin domain